MNNKLDTKNNLSIIELETVSIEASGEQSRLHLESCIQRDFIGSERKVVSLHV